MHIDGWMDAWVDGWMKRRMDRWDLFDCLTDYDPPMPIMMVSQWKVQGSSRVFLVT